MCQIVVITNNKKLKKEFLYEQFNFNRDGIGFCWYKNRRWHWKKFLSFDEFYNFYTNCNYEKAVIHFRLGTSGSKDISNVHPFLISKDRDIDLSEGVLQDNEVLIMQNGVTNEIFGVAKFVLLEDTKAKNFSDTKTIAYLFKKLDIFNVEEITKRLQILDSTSRFVIITNKKVRMVGNFTKYDKDVLLSNSCYRYRLSYYSNNIKRLSISSKIETIVSTKLNKSYAKVFLRYDFNTNLFELDADGEKYIFGLKGLKRFLKRLGVEENEIKEIIEKAKEEIEKEREKKNREENKSNKNYYYYYDYYDYDYFR
jgi:predicted glutamine amidotransferase